MIDRHLQDPLGRRITLHDRTWFGHIVRGHPREEVRMVVVVDLRLAIVKTAHLARRVSGGDIEWPL